MKKPNLGPCQRCLCRPASSVCIAVGIPEQRLCDLHSAEFWTRITDWLASRGIFPVGGA